MTTTPTPADADRPSPAAAFLDRHGPHGWAYVLPMAVFLVFIQVAALDERLYIACYVARAAVVGGLLVWVWPRVRADVRWTHLGLGALVGVVGVVQWVGMDKLLLAGGKWTAWASFADPADGYNVAAELAAPWAAWSFIAVRLLGAAVVVPFMEELFWRDWLWRTVAAPNDYRLVAVGEYDRAAFWLVPLAFALVHPQWLLAVVWGLLIAWLLVRTKSLGACVVAHATTNFLLGLYVLVAWYGFGRDEWYFW